MSDNESAALKFLGIVRKAGMLKIGEDAVISAVGMGKARLLMAACDASDHTIRRIRNIIPPGTVYMVAPFSKEAIGNAVGGGQTALAAITDHGLAAAFVRKISSEYPGRYDSEKETLNKKAEKAIRRRRESERHKKNRQTGGNKHAVSVKVKAPASKEENV